MENAGMQDDLVTEVVNACDGMDREQVVTEIMASTNATEVADPEKLADFLLAKQAEQADQGAAA